MRRNRKKIIIGLVLTLLVVGSLMVLNLFIFNSKAGTVVITNDSNEKVKINLDLEKFKNKASGEFTGTLEEGSITLEILNSSDEIIWQEEINDNSAFKKDFKIKDFGENIQIIILRQNASGTINYEMKSK